MGWGWEADQPAGEMEQLQKPGCKVSKHSVELKVQIRTGKEGVRVGEVSGWLTESVPRIQTQNYSQNIKWKIKNSLTLLVLWQPTQKSFSVKFVSSLGLFTGEWCFHPPCWEQRELPFSTAALQKPAVKAKTSTDFDHRCAYLWFPSSTTADLGTERPKERHAFKVLRGWQQISREEANRGTDVSGRGDKHTQSSLENREIFQTLLKAKLYPQWDYLNQGQTLKSDLTLFLFYFENHYQTIVTNKRIWYKGVHFHNVMMFYFTSISGKSVWNIVTPVRTCLGQVRGSFFETVRGGGVGWLVFKVDELVGDEVGDLTVHMQPGLGWCTHQSRQ